MKKELFLLLILSNFAALSQTAKYSNDFLNIGVGAKWMGMGNTGSAGSLDVTSAYWNPAGLIGMHERFQVEALHASYFAGMASYNHIGLGYKPDTSSALAATILRFGVDDIPNTTDLIDSDGNINYDNLKNFSVADYAFIFSYAKKLSNPNLWVGGNIKMIYRNVGKFASAWGFGLDASARFQYNGWFFGATLRDATSTFNLWSFNSEELEITINDSTFNITPDNNLEVTLPRLIIGVYRSININEKLTFAPEINLDFTFDGKRNTLISGKPISIDPHVGFEVGYLNLLFIRAGINNIQRYKNFPGNSKLAMQPSLGMGVKFKSISVDYAMTNVGNLGYARYSNIFSINWKFDSLKRSR